MLVSLGISLLEGQQAFDRSTDAGSSHRSCQDEENRGRNDEEKAMYVAFATAARSLKTSLGCCSGSSLVEADGHLRP